MKKDMQVSPVTAGLIIAVVAVVVILIGIKLTHGPSKVELSSEQMKKMQEMGHGGPMTVHGQAPVSAPPEGAFTGR